jgi:hypothetical protein
MGFLGLKPKTEHHWLRKYVPVEAKALKPMRRSHFALIAQLPGAEKYAFRLQPYNGFLMFICGWMSTNFLISWYNSAPTDKTRFIVDDMSPVERIEFNKQKDPNRIPWPLLHKYVTEMREGKRNMDDLGKLWDQCRYYYGHDWLVPIEITQILKYSTGKLLSQYVVDPEEMRKQLLFQLINVRYDRVKSNYKVSADVKDIIAISCDDLATLDFSDRENIPLVPVHSSRATGATDKLIPKPQ